MKIFRKLNSLDFINIIIWFWPLLCDSSVTLYLDGIFSRGPRRKRRHFARKKLKKRKVNFTIYFEYTNNFMIICEFVECIWKYILDRNVMCLFFIWFYSIYEFLILQLDVAIVSSLVSHCKHFLWSWTRASGVSVEHNWLWLWICDRLMLCEMIYCVT